MKFLRKRIVSLLFLGMVGLAFLNLSFFLAEVAVLRTTYNKAVVDNIVKIFTTSLAEEETDMTESAEEVLSLKEVDLLQSQLYHLRSERNIILRLLKGRDSHFRPQRGYQRIVTPPPDFSFSC